MTLAEIVTIEAPEGRWELTEAAGLLRRLLKEPDEEALALVRRHLASYAAEDAEATEVLRAVLASMAAGEGKGAGFLLTGPAGCGKSHLLGALVLLAGSDEARRSLARQRDDLTGPLRALHGAAPLLVVPVPLEEHRGHDELLEDIIFERTEWQLRRDPWKLQVPLSQHAYALELVQRHVVPRYEQELDQFVAERQEGVGSWAELREADEEAAVRMGHQFAQTINYPLDFRQSRVERMARLLEVADGERISGIVYVLDDLGAFISSESEKAMHGDLQFLEFLAHRSKIAPIWTVAALEVPLRELPGVEPHLARRISDLYGGGLVLSAAHMRSVACTLTGPATDEQALAETIEEVYAAYREAFGDPGFTSEQLWESYPLDPAAARCAEEISVRLLGRADGLLRVMTRLAASGALGERSHLQPAGADLALELLNRELRSNPEAAPYLGQVLEYYEAHAAEVSPAAPELLRRLVRLLIALRLANLWPGAGELAPMLGLDEGGQPVVDAQSLRELLEAMRLHGRFVEVRRGAQEREDAYYVEVRTALSDSLRDRLAQAKEQIADDDPQLMQAAAAHSAPDLPLAELAERQIVEVHWLNTARGMSVSCENLLALDELELDQRIQELSDPAILEGCHLYLGHLLSPGLQRTRWEELARGLMAGRWVAGVLAWEPRTLTERELDALRELAACRALLARSRGDATDDERALLMRLEEEESRLGGQVRDLVRSAYYEGTVLSAFGEVLAGPELSKLRGDWAGALSAAAGWSLGRIFPEFAAIAPRQFISTREQVDLLVDGFIRPGYATPPPESRLSKLIEAIMLPMGLARRDGETWVLDVGRSAPAEEIINRIRARDQTPETQRGRPLSCPDLAQHMLKSEMGLAPELFELLITALIRSGYLMALDDNQRPVRLDGVPSPVAAHLSYVARPALLSFEQWQVLSRISRIVFDRAIAHPDHAAQALLWENLVEAREQWLKRIAELREGLEDLRRQSGQPTGAWREATSALRHTERFFELIQPGAYAAEGLSKLLDGAGPYLETANGITKLRDLLRVVELLEHFAAEVGPQLLTVQAYLRSEDLWLPGDSDLAELRDRLMQVILSGENAVGEEQSLARLAQVFFARYKRHYAAWHNAVYRSSEFEPYESLRASPQLRVLAQLDRLDLSVQHDINVINDAIEAELAKRCRELNLSQALDHAPVCPVCGLRLGEELELRPVEELLVLADRGVAEYIGQIRAPRNQQALAEYLKSMPHRGEMVRRLAEIIRLPADAGARSLIPLLGDDVLTHLQRALTGQQVLPRSLSELRRQLAGRTISRAEARKALEAWLEAGGGADDDMLRIEP
ncbi:MAG TPA: DUF6079 family protein [Armatimonadota bacterium]|nr:DUF6079 family protein [Armatimonadota bacterium]